MWKLSDGWLLSSYSVEFWGESSLSWRRNFYQSCLSPKQTTHSLDLVNLLSALPSPDRFKKHKQSAKSKVDYDSKTPNAMATNREFTLSSLHWYRYWYSDWSVMRWNHALCTWLLLKINKNCIPEDSLDVVYAWGEWSGSRDTKIITGTSSNP